MGKRFTLAMLLLSAPLSSCPFCDYGGDDTALFVIAFFGVIALGMISLLIGFVKLGMGKNPEAAAQGPLEAEGIAATQLRNKGETHDSER